MGRRKDRLSRQDRRRRRSTQGARARYRTEKARHHPVRVLSTFSGMISVATRARVSLQAASEDYYHVLSKKKESPFSGEAEKLMPLDALGIVMVTHGEEYGDDSAFGERQPC